MKYEIYFQCALAVLDFGGALAYLGNGNLKLACVFLLYGISSIVFAFVP